MTEKTNLDVNKGKKEKGVTCLCQKPWAKMCIVKALQTTNVWGPFKVLGEPDSEGQALLQVCFQGPDKCII